MLPDITFVDLQYTDTSEERALFKQRYGIEVLKLEEIDNFNDIDGLASLIDACDCVVSVSNTTVHIAGAIGKRDLFNASTREGEDYGIGQKKMNKVFGISLLKIIEQTKIGQWDNVIQQIKNNLVQKKNNEIVLSYEDLCTLFENKKYKDVVKHGIKLALTYRKTSCHLLNLIGSSYLHLQKL